ncbi:MAG: glutamate racemase [Candidatus Uhrbacteria bacterium]|nr:glutamate racemase [Candidatus Uhrbacteria bacterium]
MTIGVFDSGLGGLSVLKAFVKIVPEYDYVYLGDNARAPYGGRSADRIFEFTKQGVQFLFDQGCALVVLGCNSASADALRRLQQEWLSESYPDRRVLGVIIPAAEAIAKNYSDRKIGIIGTRATMSSNAYIREIEKCIEKAPRIEQVACPLLVPLIEEGWEKTVPAKMIIKKYLRALKSKQVALLVLGCTHYAFIQDTISRVMGKKVVIIDPGVCSARALKTYLEKHPEIESRLEKNNILRIYSTDTSERIQNLAQRFWGKSLAIEKIDLDS